MYPPITYELLKSKKACDTQLALVKEHFGLEPIPLTDEVIGKFGSMFDIEWAASRLLTQVDLLEYVRVTGPALSEYNKVRDLAYSEYSKVNDRAWAEYSKVNVHAMAEYNKVVRPVWSEYNRVTDIALVEYKKVMAREFIRIYKQKL